MWCRDPLITSLSDVGYCAVQLPRTGIRPLQMLMDSGRSLHPFGELGAVFAPGSAALPTVTPITAVDLKKTQSGRLKLGLGLALLHGFVSAFGGTPAGLDALYSRTNTLSFEFLGVRGEAIDLAALDSFLSAADLGTAGRFSRSLLEASGLYVITATLQSKTFAVNPEVVAGADLAAKAEAVQGAVGGNLTVTTADQTSRSLTYTGKVPLVFAFQAVQLVYRDGAFQALKVVRSSRGKVLAGPRAGEQPEFLSPAGPFLSLGD